MASLAPKRATVFKLNPFSTCGLSPLLSSRFKNSFGWRRRQSTHALSTDEVSEFAHDDHIPDDSEATVNDNTLRMALSKLSGQFGQESMLSLQHFFGARRAPVISTGSLRLDQALGVGLPKGRMVGIYEQEASWKTTLSLHVVKEVQKLGAALIPQYEVDGVQCGSYREIQSRIMTQAPRKIHHSQCNSNTLIIFINQVRKNLKLVGGSVRADEVNCGGNALKFYAVLRLSIIRKELLKTEDKATGLGICVQVVKIKLAPSMAKVELSIRFGKGICQESEALDLACEHSVVVKDGSYYFIGGKILHSREDVLRYLASKDKALDDVIRTLRCHLFERQMA